MKRPLRIFLSSQQALKRHAAPGYAFWADYFRNAFREAGHECMEAPTCDWAEGLVAPEGKELAQWQEATWSRTVDFLRQEHSRRPIDFFLGYLFPRQVLPSAVREIRALGIPCVNFFCDNVREFRQIPDSYRDFDLHWVPEHAALAIYEKAGLRFLHAPMACWVAPAQRQPVEQETLPVTFIGTRDELRAGLFAEAISLGLEVDLRGPGWEAVVEPALPAPPRARDPLELARRQLAFARQHGWPALLRKLKGKPNARIEFDFSRQVKPPVTGEAYLRSSREAMVCLGVNRYPSPRHAAGELHTYSRLRDVEAPMTGACYLTEWTEGLDDMYDLGQEIETYRTAEELVAKARALAADPARRKRMRLAAQRRALTDHSIAATIERIAERLNLTK